MLVRPFVTKKLSSGSIIKVCIVLYCIEETKETKKSKIIIKMLIIKGKLRNLSRIYC